MKETKMGNQGSSFINDPLFYGKVNMDPLEKAQLHSGDKVCHSFILILIIIKGCPLWQYGLWSFQTGGTKLERFLPKNQHTQRKLLNFENWVSEIGHHFSK